MLQKMHSIVVIFLFLLTFSIKTTNSTEPITEALLSLKAELNFADILNDWGTTGAYCSWSGIQCDFNSTRIIDLNLSSKNLSGILSGSQFFLFSDLMSLNLSHNHLSGTLLSGIFNLPKLQALDVGYNSFFGTFPLGVSKLSNLEILEAGNNLLSGGVPEEVISIPTLMVINFSRNKLNGLIPLGFGSIKTLKFLFLSWNYLTGNVPKELGNLKHLVRLEIADNLLSGGIPEEVSSLPALVVLDASNNKLNGPMPKKFTNRLMVLNLSYNDFHGSIPSHTRFPSAFLGNPRVCGQASQPCPKQSSKWTWLVVVCIILVTAAGGWVLYIRYIRGKGDKLRMGLKGYQRRFSEGFKTFWKQ